MEKYVIDEILEVLCDTDKILTVKFKIGEDDITTHREIVDSEYYSWCEENYFNENEMDDELDEYEEEGYYGFRFDMGIWESKYSDSDLVMEYIYESYPHLSDLPNNKN
jgi:hypothetical protein